MFNIYLVISHFLGAFLHFYVLTNLGTRCLVISFIIAIRHEVLQATKSDISIYFSAAVSPAHLFGLGENTKFGDSERVTEHTPLSRPFLAWLFTHRG